MALSKATLGAFVSLNALVRTEKPANRCVEKPRKKVKRSSTDHAGRSFFSLSARACFLSGLLLLLCMVSSYSLCCNGVFCIRLAALSGTTDGWYQLTSRLRTLCIRLESFAKLARGLATYPLVLSIPDGANGQKCCDTPSSALVHIMLRCGRRENMEV